MRKFLFIIFLLTSISTFAVIPSENVQISFLTCNPGNPIYSKYGHTAIRVIDPAYGVDYTYNYGVFNFFSNHFIYHFIKGETDYELAVEPTQYFIESSHLVGRDSIYEQVLNLTYEQKYNIIKALSNNLKRENAVYRYNFVFDNCATRPYNLLVNNLQESIHSNYVLPQKSYREMITYYGGKYTWPQFGINLIFGKGADNIMTKEQALFLPEQLMFYLSGAQLEDGTKLIATEHVSPFIPNNGNFFTSPNLVMILLLIITIGISIYDIKKNKMNWWFDAILFCILFVLGLLVSYLFFFSTHPFVNTNYNILFYNPIMFIPFVLILTKKGKKMFTDWKAQVIDIYLIIAIIIYIFSKQQGIIYLTIPLCILLRNRLVIHPSRFTFKGHKAFILALCLIPSFLNAQKLKVVVLVDGLNNEALTELRDYWQQGGIRTLSEEAYQTNVSFKHLVYGGSECTATLMTGTNPCEHGISADTFYVRRERKPQSIFYDHSKPGIGTNLRFSPSSLLALTISDEFRISHNNNSKIYAIGINPENTILMAGHSANACTWIDIDNMHWATTSFYPEGLPSAADEMNINGKFLEIASKTWEPRMDIMSYLHPTNEEIKNKGFTYNSHKLLRQTPAANNLVIELAVRLQKQAKLGMDGNPDLLLLELTANTPKNNSDMIESAEKEDMYLWLNQDLGFLMEQLNKTVGKDNYDFVLVGKPSKGYSNDKLLSANIQPKKFNVDRAAALINTYLMAIYGHERWIDGGFGQSIYVNKTLIEQKKMSIEQLERQISDFLLEFEGVAAAYPIIDVPMINDEALKNSCNKRCFGDIVFSLQPLYKTMTTSAPLFILSAGHTPHPEGIFSATDVKSLILK